jgi:hypothetical protein
MTGRLPQARHLGCQPPLDSGSTASRISTVLHQCQNGRLTGGCSGCSETHKTSFSSLYTGLGSIGDDLIRKRSVDRGRFGINPSSWQRFPQFLPGDVGNDLLLQRAQAVKYDGPVVLRSRAHHDRQDARGA